MPIEISCRQVAELRESDEDFLLLDCREPAEHALARIEGARLIPMNEIPARLEELEPYRSRRVVVQCHHGGRSMMVVEWLRAQGFAAAQNMAGGIDAWSVEVDSETPRY